MPTCHLHEQRPVSAHTASPVPRQLFRYQYRFSAQKQQINLNQVEQWYMTDWERMNELYTFRTGYLKLAPVTTTQDITSTPQLLSG